MDATNLLQSELRALYVITEAISGPQTEEEILATILERTVTELGYRAATLRLLDAERQTLELKASYGLSSAYLHKGEVVPAHSGIDQRVLAGEQVVVADVRHDTDIQYPEAAAEEGLASVLAVPLALRERIIGVVRVYTAEQHEFSAEETRFLSVVSTLGGQAIQRAHLYTAFQAIANRLASSLDLSEVLATLLVQSVQELNVKGGAIRLLGPNREILYLAAAYGLSQSYLNKGEVKVAQSPVDQQVLRGASMQVEDVTQDEGFQYAEAARREGIRSVLVLPLRAHDATIGVLRMYSGQVRHFGAEEVSFVGTVADLGAVAIENARLHAALKARLEALKEDSDGWYRFLTFS